MAHGDQRARDAFGVNTERLLAVKSHYDPDRVFAAIPLPEIKPLPPLFAT